MASILGSMGAVLEQYSDKVQEYLSSMTPIECVGWLLAGFGVLGIIAGTLMALDDIHDLGRTSYPGHPSPLHHWMYGIIIIALSSIALAVGVALIVYERFSRSGSAY